ncbi:glycosyltransferase family 2 protein [Danxiaibacter flavus]|uniref:Glycosyltransferase family 2 protein n=1 Tax=Danxiaibacter flavus TaxID=3049108 RepID=A0ABV3ZJU7_9BACT|nr:glycosyltransferase family 2 protein [Chitinophagaceae bacterium DXS]
MSQPKKVLIIIPCYNEAASIGPLLRELYSLTIDENFELKAAVINDCSTDNTADVVRRFSDAVLLDLPVNLGIGGAMQTGFKYAYENGFDYAIQADGDGQHPVSVIPDLLSEAEKGNCDIVIGSRFLEKKGFQSSTARRAGIRYFKQLNRALTGITVTDNTSGFRLFNKRALELSVQYYPDKYPEPESIIVFALNGLTIKEIPVEMNERQGGVSSISAFSAVYYMCKVTLGIFYTFMRLKTQFKWQRSRSSLSLQVYSS